VAANPAVQKMVTMTPYQADVSARAPKLEAPVRVAEPPKAKAAAEDEPAFEEPKKRESKKVTEPVATVKKSLDSVVAAWSDEE